MAVLPPALLRDTRCASCGCYSLWAEDDAVRCYLCGAEDRRFVVPQAVPPLVSGRELG